MAKFDGGAQRSTAAHVHAESLQPQRGTEERAHSLGRPTLLNIKPQWSPSLPCQACSTSGHLEPQSSTMGALSPTPPACQALKRGALGSRAPGPATPALPRRGCVLVASQAPKHEGPAASTSGRDQAERQQQQQPKGWRPASALSGWAGAGSALLSMGAVTGGGLMGEQQPAVLGRRALVDGPARGRRASSSSPSAARPSSLRRPTHLAGSGFDIEGPWSVAQAVLVLGATVGFHELGHFLLARGQGIHVTKFAVGFGPTLLKFQRGEVEYSLRALPLGGYVAFPDDDPDCPFPEGEGRGGAWAGRGSLAAAVVLPAAGGGSLPACLLWCAACAPVLWTPSRPSPPVAAAAARAAQTTPTCCATAPSWTASSSSPRGSPSI